MWKRSNACSRPVLMIRGLVFFAFFELAPLPLCSFEGTRHARPRPFPVAIARGIHLFPFRTESLSLFAPMVLGGKLPGRVGRRRDTLRKPPLRGGFRVFSRRSVGVVASAAPSSSDAR